MANKKDILTGSIMEVPLVGNLGFGYVKVIFTYDIAPEYFGNIIYKIYNKFSKQSKKGKFISEEFENDEIIIYPLLGSSYPPLRGKDKWYHLGISQLTEEDKILPDYLIGNYLMWNNKGVIDLEKLKNTCEESKFGVSLVRNFANKSIMTRDFQAIKHIGVWSHWDAKLIGKMVSINYIKLNSLNLKDFYSDEEYKNDYWLRMVTNKTWHRDETYFRTLKKGKRLKAQIKI